MSIAVTVPVIDVNSEMCRIVRWFAKAGDAVGKGTKLAEVETSKSVFEIDSPGAGVIGGLKESGQSVPIGSVIATIFSDKTAMEQWEKEAKKGKPKNESGEWGCTEKAKALAEKYGVDLKALNQGALITEKDVKSFLLKNPTKLSPSFPKPLPGSGQARRILLIGAGLGATQVLEILRQDPAQEAVGVLDDDPETWGREVNGIPVVGSGEKLGTLFVERTFDGVIIAISTSISARVKYRELCRSLSIPLFNAIDSSCQIAADARLGTGNVLCAFCHVGTGTVLGDNNFISAYNSIDHHCVVGSDLSTGPGCMVSGIVKIGSRVRMGTGIFIQPYLEIGDDVQIASGSILVQSVPASHAVKTKVVTSTVVPIRRA